MIAPPNASRCPIAGEGGPMAWTLPGGVGWTEPNTSHTYPIAYPAYRRTREAEEKPLPRHRGLGPEIDHYVWQRWQGRAASAAEVRLTLRPGAPPRVQRIVAEILRAIRRGQSAGEAIRHVSRRFGLRQTRARAFITACLCFEVVPRADAVPYSAAHGRPTSSLADWG